jgi:transcriptional regulator with GAF, ATPase, and Fis domain
VIERGIPSLEERVADTCFPGNVRELAERISVAVRQRGAGDSEPIPILRLGTRNA